MIINDDVILQYFFGKEDNIISGRLKNCVIPLEYKEYLKNRFKDSQSIKESIYRIKYKINERPVCKSCGGPVKFLYKNLFRDYCSYKCLNSNKEKIAKGIETSLSHWGKGNGNNRQKYHQTCLQKFGVDHPFKNNEIIKKCKKTFQEKTGYKSVFDIPEVKEKSIRNSHTKEAREKAKNTCLIKFGAKTFSESKEGKKLMKIISNSQEVKNKKYQTYKNNNSFKSSKLEKLLLLELSKTCSDIKTQYKDERYPFNCDFYIPEFDLFIELNNFWSHGKHPFDKHNINDVEKLKIWESKNTKFFENAIQVWTGKNPNKASDPKKREYAKKNNLNYLELWSSNTENNIEIIKKKIEEIKCQNLHK